MLEQGPRLLPSIEDYPLIKGKRTFEFESVLDMLNTSPVVFIWGRAGNGKTGFARELAEDLPWKSQFVHPSNRDSCRKPTVNSSGLYDTPIFEDTQVMIFDEFAVEAVNPQELVEDIEEKIEGGKKFVFFLHEPRSQYVDYRRYRKKAVPHVVMLIKNHPDAPWFYLRKFKKRLR